MIWTQLYKIHTNVDNRFEFNLFEGFWHLNGKKEMSPQLEWVFKIDQTDFTSEK